MRYMRIIVAAMLLTLSVAVAAASLPLVQQILPANNSIKGFSIMKHSLQYGKGDDLTKIYDGGYELYTKNGVIDAARQMYQKKNDYVEVTTHTMKSSKTALNFLKYWQKENKIQSLSKTKASTYFTISKPTVMTYAVTGKYFTTISAFYPADRAKADEKAFLSVVEKRISGINKPSKGK